MRRAALTAALVLAACGRKRAPPACPAPRDAAVDAAGRVRTIAEVPPPGRSADGREVDVPIAWIHLLAEPAPTGSAPAAVVGAEVPCGYRAHWANATRAGDEVRLRLRARWQGDGAPPATPAPCPTPTPSVQIVSLSVLRLGAWRVTDATPRAEGAPPAPSVTLHVVRDDASLPPPIARWYRACAREADCGGGSVCARVGEGAMCLPPLDPWTWSGRPCVDGTTARPVTRVDAPTVRWSACIANCVDGGCPAPLRCDPRGACIHALTQGPDAGAVSVEGPVRHDR